LSSELALNLVDEEFEVHIAVVNRAIGVLSHPIGSFGSLFDAWVEVSEREGFRASFFGDGQCADHIEPELCEVCEVVTVKLGLAHHCVDVPDSTQAALAGALAAQIWKVNTVRIAHKYRLYLAPSIDEHADLAPYLPGDRG